MVCEAAESEITSSPDVPQTSQSAPTTLLRTVRLIVRGAPRQRCRGCRRASSHRRAGCTRPAAVPRSTTLGSNVDVRTLFGAAAAPMFDTVYTRLKELPVPTDAGAWSCTRRSVLVTAAAKVAVTLVFAVRVMTHVPVPVQPPPVQPVKVEPAAGVAVRVTAVPLG